MNTKIQYMKPDVIDLGGPQIAMGAEGDCPDGNSASGLCTAHGAFAGDGCAVGDDCIGGGMPNTIT